MNIQELTKARLGGAVDPQWTDELLAVATISQEAGGGFAVKMGSGFTVAGPAEDVAGALAAHILRTAPERMRKGQSGGGAGGSGSSGEHQSKARAGYKREDLDPNNEWDRIRLRVIEEQERDHLYRESIAKRRRLLLGPDVA